jgi:phenylacetate-coenzyme A ligase PaaK-like adenylate-forming protein
LFLFINYCELFIDKLSDDLGVIKQKLCDCGVYCNYLEEFKGKVGQCLVSMKGTKYSASFIMNLFLHLPFELEQYEILQTKNKDIEFKTKNAIDNSQAIRIATLLDELMGDLDENFSFSVVNNNRTLSLSPSTNLYIKFIVKNPRIYKNKTISVRSYA